MEYHLYSTDRLSGALKLAYAAFLNRCGLRDEQNTDYTVLYQDEEEKILACGSLRGNTLMQIAVSPEAEGMGLCALIVSELISAAILRGDRHLFLYTKPKNDRLFAGLGFYPIVSTDDILLMENRRSGFSSFLEGLPHLGGRVGAVVCNCNPFTLGHRHLIETAASECDYVLVFVVSEDLSLFPADIRYELVRSGTTQLKNVHVVRSGDYLVSRATFPTYFIKEKARCEAAACALDIMLFAKRVAPELGISVRYVGQEPFDPVTRSYNEQMKRILPQYGIELREIPRHGDISATVVRKLLSEGRLEEAKSFLPENTYEYCKRHFGTGSGFPGETQ